MRPAGRAAPHAERTTLYQLAESERTSAALSAAPLAPVTQTAARKYERDRDAALLRNQLIAKQGG